MASLYVETNLLVGIALGRVPGIRDLLPDEVRPSLFLPAICIMESFSFLEGERKRRLQFEQTLRDQIVQLKRDTTSDVAASLLSHIQQAHSANGELIQAIETRLYQAIDDLSGRAALIGLDSESIAARGNFLIKEPTDNLILHCILRHARSNPDGTKAITSENHRDFDQPVVLEAIADAGLRYFREANRAIEWLGSTSSGETGA